MKMCSGLRNAPDVGAADHAIVHPGTADLLAHPLTGQGVDLLEGQPRQQPLGLLQQALVGREEGLGLRPRESHDLVPPTLDHGDAVGDRAPVQAAARQHGQDLAEAAHAQPMDIARSFGLAEPDRHHLGEPALDRPVEARVRLDARQQNDRVRPRRLGIEPAGDAPVNGPVVRRAI